MNEFLSAAESVFSFVEFTAEQAGDGYRWKTFDYNDQPHYHHNIFNGVGGIPIFLGAYHKATKSAPALEYAYGAIRWCITATPVTMDFQRGLQFGKIGAAYAALYVSGITGEDPFSGFWQACAANLLREEPGPITDFIGGESSNGWFLLKLWQKTGEASYLKGALRCADWLRRNLKQDALGTHCLVDPVNRRFGSAPYTGLAHGIAGVAYFFSVLFEATQDEQWRDVAYALLATLVQAAREDKGGLNWPTTLGGSSLTRCQHSHGAAGIGLVFARAARIFADAAFSAVALKAGETTYQYGDYRHNPTLCTGLAGCGELFVELFRNSNDKLWLARAQEFARLAFSYKARSKDQDYWPTDTPGCYSADFTYGGSGTGYSSCGRSRLRTTTPL